LTDTVYIHTFVKHFRMANIKKLKRKVPKQDTFFTSGIGKPVIQLNNAENLTSQESD